MITDPIRPIELSQDDKKFLEKLVGRNSNRHGEYYVRDYNHNGEQQEIWYLVSYCLGVPKDTAVQSLIVDYAMTIDSAIAAWLFINRYPVTAASLLHRHNDADQYFSTIAEPVSPESELRLQD